MDGAELQVTPGARRAIAELAQKRSAGARGLRGIVESILLTPMYNAPGSEYSTVIITEGVVTDGEDPTYLTKEGAREGRSADQEQAPPIVGDGDVDGMGADSRVDADTANCD